MHNANVLECLLLLLTKPVFILTSDYIPQVIPIHNELLQIAV